MLLDLNASEGKRESRRHFSSVNTAGTGVKGPPASARDMGALGGKTPLE